MTAGRHIERYEPLRVRVIMGHRLAVNPYPPVGVVDHGCPDRRLILARPREGQAVGPLADPGALGGALEDLHLGWSCHGVHLGSRWHVGVVTVKQVWKIR